MRILEPHHFEMLRASGITDEVIEARGYFTAKRKVELSELGFSGPQQSVPALVIPVHAPRGEIVLYQARPDQPRMRQGKVVKYETPPGAHMALDVPPPARALLGDPNIPLFITEGVKKADALASQELCGVALLGVWNWRGTNERGGKVALAEWESVALNGRRVYVVFDSDVMHKTGVHEALARLKPFIESRGAHVALIYLPAGAAGQKLGVDDFLAGGASIDDLLALATAELRGSPSPSVGDRKTIVTTARYVREITDDALSILAEQDAPRFFNRGAAVVRLVGQPVAAESVTPDALRGTLDRLADFVSIDKNGEQHPARVPHDVASDILSLDTPPFPPLEGVLGAPVLLPGGRLLWESGYDVESAYYVDLGRLGPLNLELPVAEARRIIAEEVLGDFPFADRASRAHALAVIMQPFVRLLIDGPTPLYLIDAPTRGTGKTLLADITALITIGGSAPVMSLPRDDDEIEKRITSILLGGTALVVLDNVTVLRSSPLAAALTTVEWRGRLLGRSQMVSLRNRATWLATGNNVELSDEIARRVIPIRLDAGVARPEDRDEFRHPDLVSWVKSHRAEIVSACIALAKAWVASGAHTGAEHLGRFEAWAAVIGGLLEFAGVDGFLANRAAVLDEADRSTGEWSAFCAAWANEYGERPVTSKDLLAVAQRRQLLIDIWGGRIELGALQRFGHALAKCRDRVFGEYRVVSAGRDGRTGTAAYRLMPKGGGEDPRNPGNAGLSAAVAQVSGVSGVFSRRAADFDMEESGEL